MPTLSLSTLNFQHLRYFWTVAREGSIARATSVLHLTQPTISTQLKALERSLGSPLFERRGRTLVLTDMGQLVLRYADEMFRAGRDLADAVSRGAPVTPTRMVVGISDSLPKLTTWNLLQPALTITPRFQLTCRIDKTQRLVMDLASHAVDVVLADSPAPPTSLVRVFNHLLGECGATVFATTELALRYRRRFPASLDGAPFVLQTDNTAIRHAFDAWCTAANVHPKIECEVEDVALLQVFGQEGMGLFLAPTVVEAQVRRQYGVRVVGRLPSVVERFYAISAERRLQHPGVVALTVAARTRMFG
ncbi:MAG TPA: LysR family transcriptional regulator [Gemmatimonas sp.]|nr:LysR family transcriptional regulator [Gemmatimonas sp.]